MSKGAAQVAEEVLEKLSVSSEMATRAMLRATRRAQGLGYENLGKSIDEGVAHVAVMRAPRTYEVASTGPLGDWQRHEYYDIMQARRKHRSNMPKSPAEWAERTPLLEELDQRAYELSKQRPVCLFGRMD